MKQRKEITVGEGTLIIESGYLAKQANGSCTVRLGDTVVIATACMENKGGVERDFLPLTVDYREYTYAAGRIPGGFFKREGRPSEKEIITSRQIDRPLRPLFPEGYTADTQIISFCLSADGENDPDILAINGASVALVLSNIPFYHPVGAVRVGLIDGQVVMNPTNSLRDVSDLDLVVVGTEDAVVMVEAGANQVSEELLLECIWRGHLEIKKIIKAQHEMFREGNREKPSWTAPEVYPESLYEDVKGDIYAPLKAALFTKKKFERKDAVSAVVKSYMERIPEDQPLKKANAKKIVSRLE
jgi:polyribonucleotide nucleotidyltransferase